MYRIRIKLIKNKWDPDLRVKKIQIRSDPDPQRWLSRFGNSAKKSPNEENRRNSNIMNYVICFKTSGKENALRSSVFVLSIAIIVLFFIGSQMCYLIIWNRLSLKKINFIKVIQISIQILCRFYRKFLVVFLYMFCFNPYHEWGVIFTPTFYIRDWIFLACSYCKSKK